MQNCCIHSAFCIWISFALDQAQEQIARPRLVASQLGAEALRRVVAQPPRQLVDFLRRFRHFVDATVVDDAQTVLHAKRLSEHSYKHI
jgi:hypothetical protein